MHYKTDFGVMESLRNSLKDARQQNQDLKNKLLAMRCEATKIADELWDMDGPLEIIIRIRKLAE